MAKQYDLEERTQKFALRVRDFSKRVPKDIANVEYTRQLIRSSGSIGANYLEANEALSRKDFVLRIKISRKEAKESRYWLQLMVPGGDLTNEQRDLIREATELLMIFSAIVRKTQGSTSVTK